VIIKGTSRGGPVELAKHLGNAEKNEVVKVLEVRRTVSDNLRDALIEMDAYALGTKCTKSLYHAAISPALPHLLTPEQQNEAITALEEKLGLTDHARVVVMHEKHGRQHLHVVWSRIDLAHMKTVSDSHNYRKHEEVSRDLERRFGHERVQGAHHERDGVERPERSPSRAELRQEERTGIKSKAVKAEVTAAFRQSDGPEAFRAALEDRGYLLAQGDRRDYVVVDRAGGIHSLGRRIDGMRAAELREFMSPLDRAKLPTAEIAKETQLDRAAGNVSAFDQKNWEEALAASAIEKLKSAEELAERHKREIREARADDKIEAAYARGDDFGSQSSAATKDLARRMKLKAWEPFHPADYAEFSPENRFKSSSRNATGRRVSGNNQITHLHEGEWQGPDIAFGEASNSISFNDIARQRYERMESLVYGEHGYFESEQREQTNTKAREEQERTDARRQNPVHQDRPIGDKSDRTDYRELGDEKYRRMERILNDESWDSHSDDVDRDPDRQREAPGRGRTRSR
jgi:hypothetical protein